MWKWLFGRRTKITTLEALSTFCDRQAAFNCQKNIFEFVRARATTNTESLFEEAAFRDAMERARWQGYPIALTNMLEMVAGMLRQDSRIVAGDAVILAHMQRMARGLMTSYAGMQPFTAEEWDAMTRKVMAALAHAHAMPVKPVKDIPLPRSQAFFDLIPLHPHIKGPDFKSIQNHMRVNLCRAHDELVRSVDMEVLASAFVAPQAEAAFERVASA